MEIHNKYLAQLKESADQSWEKVKPYYDACVIAILQLPDQTEAALQKLFEVTLPLYTYPLVDPIVSTFNSTIDNTDEIVGNFFAFTLPRLLRRKPDTAGDTLPYIEPVRLPAEHSESIEN